MTAKYDVAKVAALSDERFKELIDKHLHPDTGDPAVWDVLFSQSLMPRTTEVLQAMLEKVSVTLGRKKVEADAVHLESLKTGTRQEWFAHRLEYDEWRVRAVAFQKMVQRRLGAAKNVRRSWGKEQQDRQEKRIGERGPDYKDRLARAKAAKDECENALRRLALKIREHQALTAVSDRMPEQHDYDLWRLLDELTLTVGKGGEQASVRRVMESYWLDTSEATMAAGQRGQTERMMQQAPAGRAPRFEGVTKVRRIDGQKRLT